MNTLKRIFALVLCLALTMTCLVGCHKKGEVAVKVGEVEFTSGYYACALVFSDTEARALVEEQLSEEGELPDVIDYYKYKVDDTDFVEWVEENTLKTLKDLAAVKTLCKEAGVELDAETVSLSNSNADYLWDSYGYSALLASNGVSKETFKQYMLDTYLTDTYFEHIYGEGGEKEIPAEKLTEQLKNNYVLVNIIEVDYSTLMDEEKEDKMEQISAYYDTLKDGSRTFEEVYINYNQIDEEEHKHEEPAEGELAPADQHATVLGSEKTNYYSDYYESAKEMEIGEVKIATIDSSKGVALIVKKDIVADPYYIDYLDMALRNELVGEDYQKEITDSAEKLDFTLNESSIKQFKVKKIVYPEEY